MKFAAELDHISGYLRSGRLVGTLTEEEYAAWLSASPTEQLEILWECGSIEVLDYRIEDVGDVGSIEWSSEDSN